MVAPHPDDETLAVGGTLATWSAAGTRIVVVAVTDGEGSHPGRPGLADRRAGEQRRALTALGIEADPIRLGLPDTGVPDHRRALTDALVDITDAGPSGAVIVAPWELDAHCDHDATGQAAAEAARRVGVALLAYPGWAWQWAVPADFAGVALLRHRLGDDAQRRKGTAVAAFSTQTTSWEGAAPILSEQFLERFRRRDEVLIEAGEHA